MINIELEKKYLSLITDLKILAKQTKDESEVKRYRALVEQLQKTREQRHFDLVGEDGINKNRYRQMLEFVDSNYDEENGVDSAKKICDMLIPKVKEQDERY